MAAKKTAVRKKTLRKKTPATPARKATAISTRYTKMQILNELAADTGLPKQQVGNVLDALGGLIERHVRKRACGEFILPGLLKITTVRKPATKARKGINPFTGEETVFKAKPARTQIKVRPLQGLKSYVG
jgi:nucleoid DNA-binding protein